MDNAQNENQLEKIIQKSFPNANEIQILENSKNETHKSVVSRIIDLTIEYEEDEKQHKAFLIVKVPTTWEANWFHDEMEFFTRETYMYDVIIPRMNSYLDEPLTPLCYKTIDSRILTLENLVMSNYERLNDNRLHLEQCLSSIEAIAHFHAASYKISQVNPDLLLKKFFNTSPAMEWGHRMANFWEPVFLELLRRTDETLISKLRSVSNYMKREDNDARLKIHYSNFEFFVLNHGDFRNENILLKYDSTGKVDGVKLVDFQTCILSTPINDFMYFVIQSASVDVIENHFETLLNRYLECLNKKLKSLDCNKTYKKENFLQNVKTLDFCSITFIMLSATLLCPLDRLSLLDVIFQKNTDNIQYYIEICLSNEHFTSHVLSCFKLCQRLGLFESTQQKLVG